MCVLPRVSVISWVRSTVLSPLFLNLNGAAQICPYALLMFAGSLFLGFSIEVPDSSGLWTGPGAFRQLTWWRQDLMVAVGRDQMLNKDLICELRMHKTDDGVALELMYEPACHPSLLSVLPYTSPFLNIAPCEQYCTNMNVSWISLLIQYVGIYL